MTKRRPRSSRRSKPVLSRPLGSKYEQVIMSSIEVKSKAQFKGINLTIFNKRSFRPTRVQVEATSPNGPACLQISLRNEDGEIMLVSRPKLVGPVPVQSSLAWPRETDMFPIDWNQDVVIFEISNICVSSDKAKPNTSSMSVVIRFSYEVGPELFAGTCPPMEVVPLD